MPAVTYRWAAMPPVAVFLMFFPGFEPYAQVLVPDVPVSPKFQV